VWDEQAEPLLPTLRFTDRDSRLAHTSKRYLMSNSFAFGGNNISLIIGDAP
jgi:3-oxoacyl-[acyl-carrier-protein] synthase-1